jgi:preprotein translocase subunit SecG
MLRMGLTIIQLFASIAIIALVLLQRGKGADAGAGFGAGASGTVFGARGARTALSRATAIFAAIFMVNSLALAYMGTREAEQKPTDILDQAGGTATPAPAAPSSGSNIPAPATQTPGAGDAAAPPATGAPPQVEAPATQAPAAPQGGSQAPATGTQTPSR